MTYRPQFAVSPTPPGFEDEEFEYFFDQTNTPALAPLASGQSIFKVVLQTQADAEFICRAFQISGNTGPLCVKFYDAFGNELSATILECDREYAASLNGGPPLGRLPVPIEPEMPIPASGFLQVDISIL